MNTHRILPAAFIFSAAISLPALSAPVSTYVISSITATDLGTLGGAESEARDINNAGQIVGWADYYGGAQAFIYSNGNMHNISHDMGGWIGAANGINTQGDVVGYLNLGVYSGPKGFYWHNGTGQVLNDLGLDPSPEYNLSVPSAINDDGYIAGTAYKAFFPEWAVYWSSPNGYPVVLIKIPAGSDLETIITYVSHGRDINNTEQIVGVEQGSHHVTIRGGFVYQGGLFTDIPPPLTNSNCVSYDEDDAYGINELGHVTGQYDCVDSSNTTSIHAFFWNGSASYSYDLGVLSAGTESSGNDINNQDFVAGEAEILSRSGSAYPAAFLWHADFGMQRLPPPPGFNSRLPSSCRANALNDVASGIVQVVGYCTIGGNKHATLWDVKLKKSVPFNDKQVTAFDSVARNLLGDAVVDVFVTGPDDDTSEQAVTMNLVAVPGAIPTVMTLIAPPDPGGICHPAAQVQVLDGQAYLLYDPYVLPNLTLTPVDLSGYPSAPCREGDGTTDGDGVVTELNAGQVNAVDKVGANLWGRDFFAAFLNGELNLNWVKGAPVHTILNVVYPPDSVHAACAVGVQLRFDADDPTILYDPAVTGELQLLAGKTLPFWPSQPCVSP
jgi:probable HAF family extracellular repeat protein